MIFLLKVKITSSLGHVSHCSTTLDPFMMNSMTSN